MKIKISRPALSELYKNRQHLLDSALVVVIAFTFFLSSYRQVSDLTHAKPITPITKVKLSVHKAEAKLKPSNSSTVASASGPVTSVPGAAAQSVSTKSSASSVTSGVTVGVKREPVVTPSPSSNVSGLTPTNPTSGGPSSSSSTGSSTGTGSGSGSGSGSGTGTSTPTTTSYTSTNWSGYLETTEGDYTSVSGGWMIPSVTGNGKSTSADSAWVGIGGVTSSDLIQVGTSDTVTASGQVSSNAFYEMLPGASVTIPSMIVSPGDSISASVTEDSTDAWTISITDNTTDITFTKVVDYGSTNSSAEWVEEDPSYNYGRLVPFDDFDSISFFDASTTSNGVAVNLSSGDAQPITMVNELNQPVATPSAIVSDGASFSITYGH